MADSWAESSTFHCYPSWESTLWCCRAPLQDSLWTSGKLQWINGYCSQVSCWGLACAIVSRPCRSLLLSTYHKPCPAYGPVRGNTMFSCVCFWGIKEEGCAQGNCKQEDIVIRVSDSMTVCVASVHVGTGVVTRTVCKLFVTKICPSLDRIRS